MIAQDNQKIETEKPVKPRLPEKTKVLLRWKAPARPFKNRDREYYTTIGAIVFLLVVILFFLKEWLLIAVLISLGFVSYVLASVPPEEVEHEILNKGVKTGGKLYVWEKLVRFWFSKKWGRRILEIEVKQGFPGRLMMLINEEDRKRVEEIVGKYINYDKPEAVWGDKAAKWLTKKIPLEN